MAEFDGIEPKVENLSDHLRTGELFMGIPIRGEREHEGGDRSDGVQGQIRSMFLGGTCRCGNTDCDL